MLLSPYHSLLYTWDDASKERELLWSVYNNADRELIAQISRDSYGEEKISFRSVRAKKSHDGSPDSSASSDTEQDITNNMVGTHLPVITMLYYYLF